MRISCPHCGGQGIVRSVESTALRVLFDLAGFQGWEGSALWECIKFDFKHFADIERIAMVGDARWEHGMAAFCKPFTKAKVQCFDHANIAGARKWLREA